MIRLITIISIFLAVAQAMDWEEFKSVHNVNYANQLEETMRRSVFERNKAFIEEFNAERAEKDGFELEVNKFADRTKEELIDFGSRKGFGVVSKNTARTVEKFKELLDGLHPPPKEIDFTKIDGRVTPVKDEGQCHAHWAFSAVGALEGQMKVQNKTMVSLSAQNLVDCSDLNDGCGRGHMDTAWIDVWNEGGIESEATYPWVAQDNNCVFNKSRSAFIVRSGYDLPTDELYLKKFLAKFGPVSVAIDSSPDSFKFYKHGIYTDESCSSQIVDRGVLLVGYGVDATSGHAYWLLKNSWGTDWGIQGYMKLRRNYGNHCGVSSYAMVPYF